MRNMNINFIKIAFFLICFQFFKIEQINAEAINVNLINQLEKIGSAFENQIRELKGRDEDADYNVTDKLFGVESELLELNKINLDKIGDNKELIKLLNQLKERASYIKEALYPMVIYFKENKVKLNEAQNKTINESLPEQLDYFKKSIKNIDSIIVSTKGGNLNTLDWLNWVLSALSFTFLIYIIRCHFIIKSLRVEKDKFRRDLDYLKSDFMETNESLSKIRSNLENSTSEVNSLNQQIMNALEKNNGDDTNHIESEYQKLQELIQAQKNILYRAIATSGSEETNNLVVSGLINFVEEVSAKSKVIHDIAFKTKVLSFNASVEAERAGARGRGFSIVAQEMKRLAEISGTASEEIASLVERTRRGAQVLNNQGEGDTSRNSIQNILVEASGNLETVQSKITEFNTFFNTILNQKGVTHSNLEYAYKVVNQIAKNQNELKDETLNINAQSENLAS